MQFNFIWTEKQEKNFNKVQEKVVRVGSKGDGSEYIKVKSYG